MISRNVRKSQSLFSIISWNSLFFAWGATYLVAALAGALSGACCWPPPLPFFYALRARFSLCASYCIWVSWFPSSIWALKSNGSILANSCFFSSISFRVCYSYFLMISSILAFGAFLVGSSRLFCSKMFSFGAAGFADYGLACCFCSSAGAFFSSAGFFDYSFVSAAFDFSSFFVPSSLAAVYCFGAFYSCTSDFLPSLFSAFLRLSLWSRLPPRPLLLPPPLLFCAGSRIGIWYSGCLPSLAIWNCLKISSVAGSGLGFLAAGALAVAALPSFLVSSFLTFSKGFSFLPAPLAEAAACTFSSFGWVACAWAFSISTFGTGDSLAAGLVSAAFVATYSFDSSLASAGFSSFAASVGSCFASFAFCFYSFFSFAAAGSFFLA